MSVGGAKDDESNELQRSKWQKFTLKYMSTIYMSTWGSNIVSKKNYEWLKSFRKSNTELSAKEKHEKLTYKLEDMINNTVQKKYAFKNA